MPLIPPKPVAEPLQPTSGVGGLRNVTADLDKLVAPEERSLGQVQTPDLSVKAQERGGEYGGVAAAQDIIGGFVKGLALLPDVVVNAGLRSLEYQKGLERGSLDRDYIDRILRSGSYEEAEPFAQGLLSIGRGEDLGTGSAVGNVLERTGEFAALAVPFASALSRMAQASKASTAARTGTRGFGTGPSAVGPTRPAFDPVTGRALGEFAPTTRRGKLGEMLLAPYRASPGTFGAAGRAEIGFGAASGAGAGIEQEAFGGSGLVGGLVAPLAAPLVLGGAKGVARASPIRFAANKLKGSTAGVNDDVKVAKQIYEGRGAEVAQESGSAAARNLVAQTLRKLEGRQQTQAGLARAEEIQTEFGEALFGEGGVIPFQLAEILDDGITTAKTRATVSRGKEPAFRAEEQRADDILQRIQNFYANEYAAGVGTGVPGESVPFVLNKLNNRIDELVAANQKEGDQLRTQLGNSVQRLDQSSRFAQGEQVRQNIINSRAEAVKRLSDRAEKEGLNDIDQLGTNEDWLAFRQEVEDTFLPAMGENSLTFLGLPEQLRRVIGKKGDDFALSFQDWKQVRQDLTNSIQQLYQAGNNADASRIGLFADMWDDFARKSAEDSLTTLQSRSPNLQRSGEKLLSYLKDYKNEVSGPFENRFFVPIRQRAGGTDDFPLYQTNAENVADTFLNSVEGVRSYKQLYGPDGLVKDLDVRTQQMDALNAALRDRAYREAFKKNGEIDTDKFDAFLNKYSEVIDELRMRAEFEDIRKIENEVSARQALLTERGEAIKRNQLFQEIRKYGDFDAANQELLFDKLFTNANRQKLADIRKAALEDGFEKQWNQVVLDSLNKKVFDNIEGDILNNPSKLLEFVANGKNRQILNNALGAEHVDRIQLLADFADRVNRILPKTEGGRVDFAAAGNMNPETLLTRIFESVGTSVPQATTRFIAIQEGRIGYRAAMAYFLARAINSGSSARYDAVLTEALTNPAFARQIMKEAPAELLPNGQTGLPLQGPRDTITDFFFRRGVPAAAILGTEAATGNLEPQEEPEFEGTPVIPPAQPEGGVPIDFNFINPTDPPQNPVPIMTPPRNQFAQQAPAPRGIAAAPQSQPANFAELFPFDTTGQAIERRRGIASLV